MKGLGIRELRFQGLAGLESRVRWCKSLMVLEFEALRVEALNPKP